MVQDNWWQSSFYCLAASNGRDKIEIKSILA